MHNTSFNTTVTAVNNLASQWMVQPVMPNANKYPSPSQQSDTPIQTQPQLHYRQHMAANNHLSLLGSDQALLIELGRLQTQQIDVSSCNVGQASVGQVISKHHIVWKPLATNVDWYRSQCVACEG